MQLSYSSFPSTCPTTTTKAICFNAARLQQQQLLPAMTTTAAIARNYYIRPGHKP